MIPPRSGDTPGEKGSEPGRERSPTGPRPDKKTLMIPVPTPSGGVASPLPAGEDLARVPLPEGWEVILEVVAGPDGPVTFRVSRSRVLIGRGEVDIPFPSDLQVSRRHASLEVYGAACVLIKDLGSSNGTFVNGRRVTSAEVQDGDEIRVGHTRMLITLGTPP